MRPNSIHWVEDLSPTDTLLITEILRLPENSRTMEGWHTGQEEKIESLPAHLKRPKSFIPRFAEKFARTKAVLCLSHRQLDPQLIRRLFIAVVDECTIRVRRFTESPPTDDDIRLWWRRILSINSLWTQPILYRYLFDANSGNAIFDYVHNECEACIIATIGGNLGMISDLRICAITRRKRRSPVPRIIRILDGWLYWTGVSDRIKTQSEPLYLKVRAARREIQMKRKYDLSTIAETPEDGRQSQTTSNSGGADIIEFYRNRLSQISPADRQSELLNNGSAASLHPAFRERTIFNSSTRRYARSHDGDIIPTIEAPGIIPLVRRDSRIVSSIYSNDDLGVGSSAGASKKTEWNSNDYAEQRSKEYRRLVSASEIVQTDGEDTLPLTNICQRSSESVKRWRDSSNVPGDDEIARNRAATYAKLDGKGEDGGQMSLDVTWEEFQAQFSLRRNPQRRW